MRDFMTLGPVPYEEDCVQVNSNEDYLPAMNKEVRRFVEFLNNRFLNIPEGAYLVAGADANTAPPVKHIGYITSSYDSAALGRSFALALVANGLARKGEKIAIPMADRVVTGVITDSVFVDKENTRRDG